MHRHCKFILSLLFVIMSIITFDCKVYADDKDLASTEVLGNLEVYKQEVYGDMYHVYVDPNTNIAWLYTNRTVDQQFANSSGGFVVNERNETCDWLELRVCTDSQPIALRKDYIYGYFSDSPNLNYIELDRFDFSGVTTFQNMFGDCSSLEEVDTSLLSSLKPTSCAGMFYGCRSLKSIDLTNIDFSNCKSVASMLAYTDDLSGTVDCANSNIHLVPDWDNFLYYSNTNHNSLIFNFEGMDGSNIKTFSHVFMSAYGDYKGDGFCPTNATTVDYCFSRFTPSTDTLNINDWELNKVTALTCIIQSCSFDTLNMNNWVCSNIKTFETLDGGGHSIKNINMKNWELPICESIYF